MKLIADLLEADVRKEPDRIALTDEKKSVTYQTLQKETESIACGLDRYTGIRKPVAIYLEKGISCVECMLAALYHGDFYTVIDPDMPLDRIQMILETLKPEVLVSDYSHIARINDTFREIRTAAIEDLTSTGTDHVLLDSIHHQMNEENLAYVLFTSESTGRPKGVAVTHHNVLAYSAWAVSAFQFDRDTVFGNQAPLYFSMSVTDLYGSLRAGAQVVLLPKMWFMFPKKLVSFMNEHHVNTTYWVPSAMKLFMTMDVFRYMKLNEMKRILFAGEVMPVKVMNYWKQYYPDAVYADLFGPTETTDICTYYVVDRLYQENESLPIGAACDNCDVFAINDQGQRCRKGETGELLVRGPFVARGYYGDPVKTREVFTQDPGNEAYPDPVYHTGDLAYVGDDGQFHYVGRKDREIKHLGYRIEPGEIEAAADSDQNVETSSAGYDSQDDRIVLAYTGHETESSLVTHLNAHLPAYMMPSVYLKLDAMPMTADGKTDRISVMKLYREKKGNEYGRRNENC